MKILVTGCAGFIGAYLSKKLLDQGKIVIGIDNLNDYYDVNIKLWRLKQLENYTNFTFFKMDLANKKAIDELFCK